VALVRVEFETREKRCIEDRGRELADAASHVVDEPPIDNRARRNESLCPGSLADEHIQREGLARFDYCPLHKFCDEPNVLDSVLAGRVVGGEGTDRLDDSKIFRPFDAPLGVSFAEEQGGDLDVVLERLLDSARR